MIRDLENEIGSEIEALLREDYGEQLDGIEQIDDLLDQVLDDFHNDILAVAENYFRNSVPGLTKERVDEFLSNYEPEEEEDYE